jgi:hypothetical protein
MNKPRLGMQPIGRDVALLRVLLAKCGLAQPGGWAPFTSYQVVPYNVGGPAVLFGSSLSRSVTVRSWDQMCYVAAPNDGSNYWRFRLQAHRTGVLDIHTFYTSAIGSASWYRLTVNDLSVSVNAATYTGLRVYVDKYAGSPGGLFMYSPAVFVT